MSDLAQISIEHEGDVVVAGLIGEIDPSNARALGRELTAAVPNDAAGVVLDLSEVHYLDSSGVQLIFELAERLEGRQQRFVVAVPEGGPARRVLEIVALDETAPVVASRGEALARVAA